MKKLNLNGLEIQSFVTTVETKSRNLVGGATFNGPNCSNQLCETDICPTQGCGGGGTQTCTYSVDAICTLAQTACHCTQFPCTAY